MTSVLVLGAVAMGAAGCGDDEESGGSTDLTEFAPADAPVFVEGAIRPEGDLKDSIDAILERFPDGDTVGDELIKSINESAREDGEDFTYEDDIEPWLGERAAFYARSFEVDTSVSANGESPTDLSNGAFIAETTDEDQAREKIRELGEGEGEVTEREYNGVTYELSPDEDNPGDLTAAAVFDGVAVAGTEQGVKDTIDASQGDSLATNAEYAEFREERGSDLLLSAYADVRALLEAIPPSPGFSAQQRTALLGAYGDFVDEPVIFGAEVDRGAGDLRLPGRGDAVPVGRRLGAVGSRLRRLVVRRRDPEPGGVLLAEFQDRSAPRGSRRARSTRSTGCCRVSSGSPSMTSRASATWLCSPRAKAWSTSRSAASSRSPIPPPGTSCW